MANELVFDVFENGKVEFNYQEDQIHPIFKQTNDKFSEGYYFNNAKLYGTRILPGNHMIVFLIYDNVQSNINESLHPNYAEFKVIDYFSIKKSYKFVIIAQL